jgi:hypothetical protein
LPGVSVAFKAVSCDGAVTVTMRHGCLLPQEGVSLAASASLRRISFCMGFSSSALKDLRISIDFKSGITASPLYKRCNIARTLSTLGSSINDPGSVIE